MERKEYHDKSYGMKEVSYLELMTCINSPNNYTYFTMYSASSEEQGHWKIKLSKAQYASPI